MIRHIGSLFILVTLTACATVTTGTEESLLIATDPPGASCELTRKGQIIAVADSTPTSVTLEKSQYDVFVNCTKDGHLSGMTVLSSTVEAMTLGNLVIGGLVGVGIDAASGAMHRYPESITIALTSGDTPSDNEASSDNLASQQQKLYSSPPELPKHLRRIWSSYLRQGPIYFAVSRDGRYAGFTVCQGGARASFYGTKPVSLRPASPGAAERVIRLPDCPGTGREYAIRSCKKESYGGDCDIYAIRDEVVWKHGPFEQ